MILFRRAALAGSLATLFPGCAVADGRPLGHDDGPARPAATATLKPGDAPRDVVVPSAAPLSAVPRPDPEPPACPQGMARIDGFCIDRYEAHLVRRGPAGEITPYPHFQRPEEGVAYEARSEAGAFPQAYISRVESEAACANAEKRLCTRREWQRACMGEAHTTYPYGARWEAKRCNAEKQHLLTLFFGADPRRWAYAQFNDPSLDKEPGFLSRSGEYAGCESDAGVFDLVGNLHEWVSDTATATVKARLDSDGTPRGFQYWSPGNGIFMGGFYSTHAELGPGCTFTTIAHEPRYHDYSTGFRCCADAP